MLEQAQRDFLTGFCSRGELEPYLEQLINEAKVSAKNFSVVLVDLDRFKKFNDKFGHIFGDEILKYATSTLRLTFYKSDCYLFRYGGDEFIGVFLNKEPKDVLRFARQCNYNLQRRPFLFDNKFYRITVSCGIAGFPHDGRNAQDLIKRADEAMYFSKRNGRNSATLYGRINFLKVRRIFLLFCSFTAILFAFFIFYRLSFKKVIQPTILRIKRLTITTKPKNLDSVVLKNGLIFEGRILAETTDKVTLTLYLDRGEGATVFDKSEIAQIKYATESSADNQQNPNEK